MKPSKILHISASDEGEAAITCPQCKKNKRVKVSVLPQSSTPLKTRCGCGCIFRLVIDTEDSVQKPMNVSGAYAKLANLKSKEFGFIDVERLSLAGITFNTRSYHTIEVGEIIKIHFVLNSTEASEIVKMVLVKDVDNNSIHAEYCNKQDLETELMCYLKAG